MPAGVPTFGKFGQKKKRAYLKLLSEGISKSAAAKAVGVSDELVRLYRKRFKSWAGEEEKAQMAANDIIEDALFATAKNGNVTACQVWLYNRSPDRWADMRRHELTGKDGGPMEILALTASEQAAVLAELHDAVQVSVINRAATPVLNGQVNGQHELNGDGQSDGIDRNGSV